VALTFVLRSEDPRVSPADLSALCAALRADQPAVADALGVFPANIVTDELAASIAKDAIVVRIVTAAEMDVAGAEAYHSIDDAGHPFALVGTFALDDVGGVLTGNAAVQDSVSIALSHEIYETEADRGVNLWADRFDGVTEVAFEPADPFQGSHREVAGVWLANFALPAWFDANTPKGAAVDMARTGSQPLVLGIGGYQVLRHVSDQTSTEWNQHRAACARMGLAAPLHGAPWIDFHPSVPDRVRARVRRRARHRMNRQPTHAQTCGTRG
jgi:hypothetical protein